MRYLGQKEPGDLLKGTDEVLENQIISFIVAEKSKEKSQSVIAQRISAISLFYEMNRRRLAWKFVRKHIPKTKRKKDRAYSYAEIEKALDIADLRSKAIILLVASTGLRDGALPDLKIRNLAPVDKYGLYKITVYEGYDEEYTTYCTPEARAGLEEYFAYRKRSGEPCDKEGRLLPDAPVFREVFDRKDSLQMARPRQIDPDTFSDAIEEVMIKAGVRTRITLVAGQHAGSVRHDVKVMHGLRKFYDTQCTLAGMNLLWIEILEGHDIKLKGSYLRPSEEDLLEGTDKLLGYVRTIDRLTINEEHRLQKQVSQLKEDLDKAAPKDMVYDLAKENRDLKQRLEEHDKIIALIRKNPKLAMIKTERLIDIEVKPSKDHAVS